MMRSTITFCLMFVSSIGAAQMQFTEFVGSINTGTAPTVLAADPQGRLYYGSFNHANAIHCHVRLIDNPLAAIGSPDEAGTTVVVMTGTNKINASGRGVQSMTFASDNTLFFGGDNSAATNNNVWKYNYTAGSPPVFTEDTTFTANVRAERPGRRSGVSIISENGNGLLITCGFGTTSFVDYFDFDGHVVGARMTDDLYYRDMQYLAPYNIAYPFRNGASLPTIVSSYISGINTATGGGSLVHAPLIPDHGTDNTTGHSIQGSYYYAAQDQIISIDASTTVDPNPSVRVFDVKENGTSVSLAYEITGPSPETKFTRLNDAVVIGNHLYICGYDATPLYESSKIYVFTVPTSKVGRWDFY